MALLRARPLLAVLVQLATAAAVQAPRVPEYQVKALFIFNFAQFVEWPAPGASVAICILGKDPFGTFLDDAVRGERLGTRPYVVRRYDEAANLESCDMLFISRSESASIPRVVAALGNRPILTVSDAADFARRGGMIQFFNDQNRVRLRINREAAEAASLTISSKLLRVAEIVRGGVPRR
jgi:hypothetical protein